MGKLTVMGEEYTPTFYLVNPLPIKLNGTWLVHEITNTGFNSKQEMDTVIIPYSNIICVRQTKNQKDK